MKKRFMEIMRRVEDACQRTGRDPHSVHCVAVSKKQSIESIKQAYEVGIRDFGENYVQEWMEKYPYLPKDIRWHFVGSMQSNKIKQLVADVYMVHCVDRHSQIQKWAHFVKEQRPIPRLLVQVNISNEPTKSGIFAENVHSFCQSMLDAGISIAGVMVFPAYHPDPEKSRPHFQKAKALLQQVQTVDARADVLSMGVSHDFEVAIEEGATHVRIGRLLFGER